MTVTVAVDNRLTAQEAVELAELFVRHARRRIAAHQDGRRYDPRLHVRLEMAQAQLKPAVELAKPEHDQVELEAA